MADKVLYTRSKGFFPSGARSLLPMLRFNTLHEMSAYACCTMKSDGLLNAPAKSSPAPIFHPRLKACR